MFARDGFLFVLPASPMELSMCDHSPPGQHSDFCQFVQLIFVVLIFTSMSVQRFEIKARDFPAVLLFLLLKAAELTQLGGW